MLVTRWMRVPIKEALLYLLSLTKVIVIPVFIVSLL